MYLFVPEVAAASMSSWRRRPLFSLAFTSVHTHSELPTPYRLLLQSRFQHTLVLSDIDEAISIHRDAVQSTRGSHLVLPTMLNCLGYALYERSAFLRSLPDIDDAISVHERSLQLASKGQGVMLHCLESLAMCYHLRSDITGSHEDLDVSFESFKRAVTCGSGPLNERTRVARLWARNSTELRRGPDEILSAFGFAVGFASLTAGLEQTVQSRFSQFKDVSGITLEGAAAACQLEEPGKAVEWLEQDDLRAKDSNLAQRLLDVSKKLEQTGSTRQALQVSMDMSTKISLEDEARSHLALSREWDELVSTVRTIPEFKFFLEPSSWVDLMEHLPTSGPIVVINVHKSRCDAIALKSHRLSVCFESPVGVRKCQNAGTLRGDGRGAQGKDSHTMETEIESNRHQGALRGLWVEVAKPILESLGYSRLDTSSTSRPPRIWWCPTGVMTFLPIHAAGIYEAGESDSVLDYAVSSYTPTITALADRVKNCCPIDKAVSGLFLTGHPKAPGVCEIGGTILEVDGIQTKAVDESVRFMKVIGEDLTLNDCLKHMGDFSSVHLACHASQNAADPLQSRFILHNGQLNLIDIIQMDLKNADLAFLSACQTSTGEEKLSDEAVHLAAGMLAAGYRRVVATMWPINDSYAPTVANDFYEYLWRDREEGEDGFDGSLSAYALHHAVQQLRQRLDESEASLLAWVPYVHFGY
ncbi:hypothetical protein NMY22_g10352 [Coprinellus aureogranulatus]|nr:hypothetical protein NMY22_g10352 [Coprinellus aureogranulatus]